MAEAKVKRPLGITILAVLNIIIIFRIFWLSLSYSDTFGFLAGIVMVLVLIFIVVGVLGILVRWGFWKGKGWAWTLGVVFYGIDIVISLLTGVTPPYTPIIGVIIGALLIYYMFRPNVKAWFGKA